jgi:hypothetical protein
MPGVRMSRGVHPVYLVLLVLAFACLLGVEARDSSSADKAVGGEAAAKPKQSWRKDWKHIDLVFSYLTAKEPRLPVVYLLGGSTARECTIADRSWQQEIRSRGGPRVLSFNLGACNESFDDNIGMVRHLPNVPTILLIGINLNRYIRDPEEPYVPPTADPSLTVRQVEKYHQHYFQSGDEGTDAAKLHLIDSWLSERRTLFDQNFAYNSRRLANLVALCRQRGFGVVLLEMPLNLHTVAHRLDEQRRRCREDCTAIGRRFSVPYVDFNADVSLSNHDFADNYHLLPSGRAKWQRRLSLLTAHWLSVYRIPSRGA